MTTYNYKRPYLYPKQAEFVDCKKNLICVEGSTKSGKTIGGLIWLLEKALKGEPGYQYAWLAPTYRISCIAYDRAKEFFRKQNIQEVKTSNIAQKLTLFNGTILNFLSGEKPDLLYGVDNQAYVIDEASRTSEEAFHAMTSTTTFTSGPSLLISNVTNKSNWFHKLCNTVRIGKIRDAAYYKIVWQDAVESGILKKSVIENKKRILSKRVFDSLFNCQAYSDASSVFGVDCIQACQIEGLSKAVTVNYGVDLGKTHDYTVIIGLDKDCRVSFYNRFLGSHIKNIAKINAVVKNTPCLVDATGAGDPIVEILRQKCSLLNGYKYSNTSKVNLIENLATMIQQQTIYFPPIEEIIKELESFESKTTATGLTTYSAATGHDDIVNALALAAWKYKEQHKVADLDCVMIGAEDEDEGYHDIDDFWN